MGSEGDSKEEKKEEAVPEAPPMPSMKLSQIVPMVVMLGMNKFDLDEMGYRRHTEVGFVIAQLVCLALIGLLHQKISAMPEDGKKIQVPELKQMGQVIKPAMEQTPKEYDKEKWNEQMKQAVMGCVILGGVYYKWQYLMPLVLQILMTPMQLYESPLFQLHMLGKTDVKRPFPAPNPFGMPAMPEAPAAVEEKKEENEEKEDKSGDEKKDKKVEKSEEKNEEKKDK